MTATRTTCAYCGVGCGIIANNGANGEVEIKGDPDHPANYGRLCTKGKTLGETLSLEDRLLTPMIDGKQASWDHATDLVAEKFKKTIAKHGPDSVAFYVSGQLLTEDYYVANKLMKGYIGSANIDTNSRLCMASSVAGHKRAFGTDTVPGTYEDLETADLIVLVGSNLAWCHPVLHQRIIDAKDTRGTKIINIDPRKTATSEMADVHLNIRPGGDVALFNGLLTAISNADAINAEYVKSHVNGLEDALKAAQKMDIPAISALTGLTPTQLSEFYSAWINTKRVVTIYSQGVNQASDGSDKVNAIINCHLATGRIGTEGCGPFSITGQPNAMGGREVGGLANMLAAHLDIENSQHRTVVRDFWDAPNLPSKAGLKAVDLFDACADGKIKALWVMCTNPAVSMPRANDVKAAIEAVDFVVVSDIVQDTDTTALADVLLPATGWGEKDGTVTNSERRISRQRSFLSPPHQTKHDWQIICEVAAKMGWGNAFNYEYPSEIFSEWAAMTKLSVDAQKDLDLTNLTNMHNNEYDDLPPIQWPVTADRSDTRFFANGGYFTADGKARMLPITPREPANVPSSEYPFILNTGRIRDHWHTMTRSAKSSTLSTHIAEPFLELNPADAERLNIKQAELVQVNSPHGYIILRTLITDRTQVGQVFAPIHWTSRWAACGRVDTVVTSVVDPVSGQPELKRTPISISHYKAKWFGFAVVKDEPFPTSGYWAKAKTHSGWRVEMATLTAPDDFEQFTRDQLGIKTAQAVTYSDIATGQNRIALSENNTLLGIMFGATNPVSLSRNFAIDAFDRNDEMDILAGFAGSKTFDAGPTICSCFNVGINTLVKLIASGKAATLEDIGANLQAGTNCGSCRPELMGLLQNHQPKIAAE
ncbi:molybdopterin-dependent oxidoreductase [Amylibacter sp. SFDW26]|uniref:nitrate reductase n=1 Tax=Amylibacter sp. SFDW26 TaxID=2652722 RepID=UPI0012614AC1|nr:nitrate reductase [Amylibacter sp. SFDW26]KAB7610065.1 molybdopterin-dependent oxidoreductase [Amylibacter sp. SFDW26]